MTTFVFRLSESHSRHTLVLSLFMTYQPTISLEMPVPSQGHYVFTVFRLLTDFVCLYNYEFGLSLCKIVRSSVILLVPLSPDL